MQTMNLFTFLLLLLSGCAISKPCSEGGDVSWNPKIIGDKKCTQKKLVNGRVVNDGRFLQAYQSNGTIALEGEFDEGKKSGIWLFYAEDHHLVAAKYFDKGVEKTPSAEVQKQIDLLIQQKTGTR
ncbi:MAG: hypothetical protein H7333_07390 [Bdellovibrionales bacterium]|nr:hypothetical protein [Oligoflexia bacterium]